MSATEHFETGSKKGRGMARRSLDLIEAMYAKAKAAQPITGRGIGYKLFTAGPASRGRADRALRRRGTRTGAAMNAIAGLAVIFDRPCDRVDLCCSKSRFGKIGPDNTMICANCGAVRGHLPQSVAAQLTAIVSKFGAPDAPIVLRAGGRQ